MVEVETDGGQRVLGDEEADEAGEPDAAADVERDEQTGEHVVAVALSGGSRKGGGGQDQQCLAGPEPTGKAGTDLDSCGACNAGTVEAAPLEERQGDHPVERGQGQPTVARWRTEREEAHLYP